MASTETSVYKNLALPLEGMYITCFYEGKIVFLSFNMFQVFGSVNTAF